VPNSEADRLSRLETFDLHAVPGHKQLGMDARVSVGASFVGTRHVGGAGDPASPRKFRCQFIVG
jgi:hypothetical protein